MISMRLLTLFLLLPLTNFAEVWTYPSPGDEFKSSKYEIIVYQNDEAQSSFTYQDKNPDAKLAKRMTDFNHFTTFSFKGPVQIEVRLLATSATGSEVRPLSAGIEPIIKGNSIGFSIEKPGKFWIKVPGLEEHPLLIFADPPEIDIPNRNSKDVLWFEAGKVHDIGGKYQLRSGQTVYIEGGAYVKGTMTGRNLKDVRICGRGILSGIDFPRKAGPQSIPWNMLQFDGPGDQTVEGITIIQPPHFLILSRGKIITTNVKIMGWHHQTDGWGGGDDSIIEDSFIKANDDIVKFYNDNQVARRLTVWQQMNGAPFQLGWGGARAKNCLAEDITIIRNEISRKPDIPSNTAFLNLKGQSARDEVKNLTFRNIRFEDDLLYLIGFEKLSGKISDITIENFEVLGKVRGPSYILTKGSGKCSDITIENFRVAGKPIRKLDIKLSKCAEAPTVR